MLLALLVLASTRVYCFEIKEIEVGPAKRFLRWDTTRGPIRVVLNPNGSADLPIASVETALKNAMNQWQNVPGQSASFAYAGRSSAAVANDSDMINSVLWIENNWPYGASVAAITRFSFFVSDPPFLADADILLNGQNFRWSLNPSAGSLHPQQILTHELGHLLGLSHSANFNATMFPSIRPVQKFTLFPDDIEGLRFLYGTPSDTFRLVTPLPGATYLEELESGGLPLPVFRWGRGGLSNFTVEFSDTPSFQRKVAFQAADNFLALTGAQLKQILQLSQTKNLQWRVMSGTTRTSPRLMRFRKSLKPPTPSPLAEAELEPQSVSPLARKEFALLSALILSLGLAAFLFLRRRRAA